MSLSTRVIAATTALALSLAAVSPAAAMDADQKKALGILIGIGAAAVLIDKMNDKDDKKKDHQPKRPVYGWENNRDNHFSRDRYDNRHDDRRDNRFDRGPSYSQSCVSKVRTPRGWSEVVDKRCADHTADRRLPQNCVIDIRQDGRRQQVYGQNCLEDRGFRMSRR